MARTNITPHKGEGKRKEEVMCKKIPKKREIKTRAHVLAVAQGPSSPVHPPSLAQETPLGEEEIIKDITEVEQWEEVGRSPQSSPTQQLAQMATEAGPSMPGGEKPARKKLQPTVGGKAPQKNC